MKISHLIEERTEAINLQGNDFNQVNIAILQFLF